MIMLPPPPEGIGGGGCLTFLQMQAMITMRRMTPTTAPTTPPTMAPTSAFSHVQQPRLELQQQLLEEQEQLLHSSSLLQQYQHWFQYESPEQQSGQLRQQLQQLAEQLCWEQCELQPILINILLNLSYQIYVYGMGWYGSKGMVQVYKIQQTGLCANECALLFLVIIYTNYLEALLSMDQNILALNPYQPHPIQLICDKICQILGKPDAHNHHIEIEFKYAELIAFANSHYDKEPLPNDIKKKVMDVCARYVLEQNALHLATIKKLSNYNLVLLNTLGPRVYRLCGGFDQNINKKFYKIREFLVYLCRQNQQHSVNPLNYFREIQSMFLNRTFVMTKQSELRLDINIKQGEKAGRYTYEVENGWILTRKQNLVKEQFDLMLAEKTFRLGIKKQQQTPKTFEEVLEAINDPDSEKGGMFLRFKRALRVVKNKEVEIALSQIYQPDQERRNICIEDLKYIQESSTLDQYCRSVFQQFYMYEPRPNQYKSFADSVSKFEIQSEFTEVGIKKIKELRNEKKYRELFKYIEITLNDLFALSFVDHNVKKREVNVITKILKNQCEDTDHSFPECRLQNQYGSYMHDLVYDYMTSQ